VLSKDDHTASSIVLVVVRTCVATPVVMRSTSTVHFYNS
jgi:hypothetical protein